MLTEFGRMQTGGAPFLGESEEAGDQNAPDYTAKWLTANSICF